MRCLLPGRLLDGRPLAGDTGKSTLGHGAGEVKEALQLAPAEHHVLLQALTLCQWNVTKTARFLHLSRDTLRYRIERLGLQSPEGLPAE
jgi:DNA-binding NtrC family response regulator